MKIKKTRRRTGGRKVGLGLTLAVLEAFARAGLAVLLSLADECVACEHAFCLEGRAQLGLVNQQGARDAACPTVRDIAGTLVVANTVSEDVIVVVVVVVVGVSVVGDVLVVGVVLVIGSVIAAAACASAVAAAVIVGYISAVAGYISAVATVAAVVIVDRIPAAADVAAAVAGNVVAIDQW